MWSVQGGRRRENFKRQGEITVKLVGGKQPSEDFNREISDLFFRKSTESIGTYSFKMILKSFINSNYYTTFFIGLKASPRWRSWTKCYIIPLTFWVLQSALSFSFRVRWLMLLSYPILNPHSQLLWEWPLQTYTLYCVYLFHFIFSFYIYTLTFSSRFDYESYSQINVVIELSLV